MDTAQDNGGITTYSHLLSGPSLLSSDSKGDSGPSNAETWGKSLETNNSLDTVARISAPELYGGGQHADDPDIPKYAIHVEHPIPFKQPVTQLYNAEPMSLIVVNFSGRVDDLRGETILILQ
ncbi:hypothetical protein FXO38_12294 [Capsicum annuum]|nr:hypothetical protein FXO38_12294 [Capsicum annuum]KAF3674595.1 hypothetical protein FXO37_06317 [Capsicum annuum]